MKKIMLYMLTIFVMFIGINNVGAAGETIYSHAMNTDNANACNQAGYDWVKNPITGASYCANKNQSYTVNKSCDYRIFNNENYGFQIEMLFLKDSGYKPVYIVKNNVEMEISGSTNERTFTMNGKTISIYGWNSIYSKRGTMSECPTLYYGLLDNPDLPDNTIELSLEQNYMGELTSVLPEEKRNELLKESCIFTATVQLSKGAFTFNGTIGYDENKFNRFCIETADENCDVNNDGMVTVRYSNDSTNSIQNYQFDFNRLVLSDFTSASSKCPSNIKYYVNEDMRIIQLYSPSSELPKNGTINDSEVGKHGSAGTTEHYAEEEAAKEREKDSEGTDVSNDCKGLLGPNTLEFLKQAMNVIMIVGPIIAVVLGTYELITAMAAGDDDAKKKGLKKFQNRLIAVALLLLVPYIVKLILNIAGKGGSDCL